MDMQERRAATKPLAINIDGETLNIKYRPQRLTPAGVRDLQTSGKTLRDALATVKDAKAKGAENPAEADETDAALNELGNQVEAIGGMLDASVEKVVAIVAEWDLTDDGVPVPITSEGLIEHDIDIPLMGFILRMIQEDQSVPPANAAPSGTRS